MTISSTTRKAGPFLGDDSTTVFPFAFKVFSESDLVVIHTDPLSAESALALGVDYTVSLNANQNTEPGGNVTIGTALESDYKLTITSNLEYLQPVDITNGGGFYPAVINTALDRLTIFCQQLAEESSRSIQSQISSDLSPTDLLDSIYSTSSAAAESAAESQGSAEAAEESAAIAASYVPYGKNLVVNGCFRVNQDGSAYAPTLLTPSSGVYVLDQWYAGTGGCYLIINAVSGGYSLSIGTGTMKQTIDGANMETGDYVLSWVGSAQGRINGGAWGDSGLVAGMTSGTNATIEFGIGSVGSVQFERGTTVTKFERVPLSAEVNKCKWYYQKIYAHATAYQTGGSGYRFTVSYPRSMRISPSASFSGTSYSNSSGIGAWNVNANNIIIEFTATANGPIVISSTVTLNARL